MFLKVCNVRFLKSSSREFHSLMEERIHDFCEILGLFEGHLYISIISHRVI